MIKYVICRRKVSFSAVAAVAYSVSLVLSMIITMLKIAMLYVFVPCPDSVPSGCSVAAMAEHCKALNTINI